MIMYLEGLGLRVWKNATEKLLSNKSSNPLISMLTNFNDALIREFLKISGFFGGSLY